MSSEDHAEDAVVRTMTTDRAEPHQQETAEQFRELMAHLQQVFWIKNAADDAVLYLSPAFAAISGHSRQSLYDNFQAFLDAVHPEDRERVARAVAQQRETAGYEQEYRTTSPQSRSWRRSS